MKKVEFKFELDQRVVTPFGDPGIITMLAYDDGGITYYVRGPKNSSWFKEKDLKE